MSNVNNRYKNIFIHIPKNAGSSMEQLHYVGGSGHRTLKEIANNNNKSFLPWAFVRNPYDKIVSLFHFWIGESVPMALSCDGFEDFVKSYVQKHTTNNISEYLQNNNHFNVGIQPQHIFLENDLFKTDDIFIGKFENIDSDFKKITKNISENCGLDIKYEKLHKKNSSKREGFKKYYTRYLYDLVYDIYKEDFLMFNYKKI